MWLLGGLQYFRWIIFGTSKNVTKYRAPYLLQKYFRTCKRIWKRFMEILVVYIWGSKSWVCFCFEKLCTYVFEKWIRKMGSASKYVENENEQRKVGHIFPFLFPGTGIPSTPQHTDSHSCTRLGWSRIPYQSTWVFQREPNKHWPSSTRRRRPNPIVCLFVFVFPALTDSSRSSSFELWLIRIRLCHSNWLVVVFSVTLIDSSSSF